ncbi:hypothetical protein HPP92_001807 [Vanilla planifolia]|uniref:sphingosine kinase n=1 Tax=Vanilla planifolia TaxID=51239 RepID=A0A835RYX6_VANPL|nr:hypothetical protein HPP92_001807 [Vanilla planifolia]
MATLSSGRELRWRLESGGEQSLAVESEVLGFEVEARGIKIRALVSETKSISSGRGGDMGKRVRKDYVLEMPTEVIAESWSDSLKCYINSLSRPKRVFIILNPFGGKRSARRIFHSVVRPLLVAANIMYTSQETKYQLHAQELAYKLDLLKYDGIVCISGDGVLVEVVNGLLQRDDWDTAIKIPLGIIPAGTGNGMAKSLLDVAGEMYSIQNATFAVIRGHKRPLDVATVLQGETRFFSILMLTWGLVADIDIESEKYRWMGRTRIDFYFILRVMKLRKYNGHLEFVPAPGHDFYGEPKKESTSHWRTIDTSSRVDGDSKVKQTGYQCPSTSFKDSEWRSLKAPL